MRSNQNPSGSVTRGVGARCRRSGCRGKCGGEVEHASDACRVAGRGKLAVAFGKALAEFALQAGFLAPLLFRADRFRTGSSHGTRGSEMGANVAQARGKQFGKGDGR